MPLNDEYYQSEEYKNKRKKAHGRALTPQEITNFDYFMATNSPIPKPGYEYDPVTRSYMPVDYINMSLEDMKKRREDSIDRIDEIEKQLQALLPHAEAQSLLNKSAEQLREMLVDLAKKAPQAVLSVLTGV